MNVLIGGNHYGECKKYVSKIEKKYGFKTNWFSIVEILMGIYCAFSFVYYLQAGKYIIGQFLLIYTLGFLMVGFRSLMEELIPKNYAVDILRHWIV